MATSSKAPRPSHYYTGEVKRQLRDGYGFYVYANTFFRYEGEWKKGKKHGRGKLLFKDGSYYEGEFMDGEITGNGLRYWASSGNTYSGEFECGELHGHGVMEYKDGGRYEGEFVYGIREGHGLLVDKEGQIYSGSFHKHKKNGEGEMIFMNGDHYQGDWVLDQRQGHGVMQFVDGTIYEGQWRNDVYNGQGTMIHCASIIYDGPWINGHPAAAAKKIVIAGEDVIDVTQGSPVTFHVQLQNDEGEVAENENGRVLKISAGIKYLPKEKNQTTSILELIEDFEEKTIKTPFGYECINYPLTDGTSCNQEQKSNIQSSHVASSMPVLSVVSQEHDAVPGVAKPYKSLEDFPKTPVSEDSTPPTDTSLSLPTMRVEAGRAVFKDVMLAPPPGRLLHLLSTDDGDKIRGKKLSGKISAEKAEKMTVSQEKIEDSRSETVAKDRRLKDFQVMDTNIVKPGEYIIMVADVTTPPFLGQTLPTAFKLIRVLPEKAKGKSNRKESLKVPNM
ncbi:MORN repeat-containing protein 1 [Discoglossus pictus]